MSRSGRIEIKVPDSTQVNIADGFISAKGKLGEMKYKLDQSTKVELSDNSIKVSPKDNTKDLSKCGVLLDQEFLTLFTGLLRVSTKI